MNIVKYAKHTFLALIGLISSATAGELTLYSHRHYQADQELYATFTKETGIEVNVVKASADELMERLKAEGTHSPADIFMTADAGRLVRAKEEGLLQAVSSEPLSLRIPEHLRDPEMHWFGFTKRARVLAYAKGKLSSTAFSTYEDLADPKWRGRLLIRSSSNIYNQSLLASIIAANGQEAAQDWARSVRKNMARPPQGSDRDQMRAIAAGLGDVALVNTYYVGLLAHSKDKKDRDVASQIALFFPNQNGRGTHVNISGAGVTAASDNVAEAVQFLEFLASDKAQSSFPQATYEYPVVPSIEWSPLQETWGHFKEDSLNLETLGRLNIEAVRTFNRAEWE